MGNNLGMELSENAKRVLEKRYLLKDDQGRVIEEPEEMLWRVAKAVAEAEKPSERERWADEFYKLMDSLRFLPNSPTLMNAGTPIGQLSACFVLPIEDSMEGIFETLKQAAKIHQSGGGTGFSFSRLRPKGDIVRSTKGVASGPVSFMRVYDAATEAVKQGGRRRGANMGILHVTHPDILEFITCKDQEGAIKNFNISVAATDEFMRAVEEGGEIGLVNPRNGEVVKRVRAREVFDLIVKQAWKNGEPGMIFIDEINRKHPLPGVIESTNPCGEQPLLPYESCNLGSVNLSKFYVPQDPWFIRNERPATWEEVKGDVDWAGLRETVRLAVRFLDDVIDVNKFPLPEIEENTKANRKVGLGVMGFADLLYMLGIPYSSEDALRAAEDIMRFITDVAREASYELGLEKGSFPTFEESWWAKDYEAMRNATVTTIAPTGTISMIADCSSGIEPVFSLVYTKNVMEGESFLYVNKYLQLAADKYGFSLDELADARSIKGFPHVPHHIKEIFDTTFDISPEQHVRMQAAFQRYTDNAVSKTINLPNSASVEDVAKAFKLAWKLKCKGITVYRDGSRTEQVLKAKAKEEKAAVLPGYIKPRPRPAVVQGKTYKVKTELGNTYITINEDEQGPLEVFVHLGKPGSSLAALSEAIGRLISLALRSSVSPKAIIEQLEGIKSVSPTRQPDGTVVFSVPDAIAKTLRKFLEEKAKERESGVQVVVNLNGEEKKGAEGTLVVLDTDLAAEDAVEQEICPECGGPLIRAEGCFICRDCGYTKCE